MSIRSIWQDVIFAFQTWQVKRQIKGDDRNGTGPLSARAYRKRMRGEPLTPEEQESLDNAEAFLAKIRTPERKENP